jgi:Tfp pilus assembly protein PilF
MRLSFLLAFLFSSTFGPIYGQLTSTNFDSIYRLALEASYANNHSLSVKHLTTLINQHAAIEGLYLDRAVQRELASDTTGAIADLSVLIKEDRNNADAYFLRGKLYVETFEYRLAYSDLKRAVRLEKSNSDAHCYLATTAEKLGKTFIHKQQLKFCKSIPNNNH